MSLFVAGMCLSAVISDWGHRNITGWTWFNLVMFIGNLYFGVAQ